MSCYEPTIRRFVRVRLTDPALRRQLDSVDICQSVMADFFTRAALGQFELESPDQLVKLLATMARNRVIHHSEKHHAARRDVRRVEHAELEGIVASDKMETPSQIIAGRELLETFRKRLSPEERELADRRARGDAWAEIVRELGGNADALRIRLGRAIDRVAGELGLESHLDE